MAASRDDLVGEHEPLLGEDDDKGHRHNRGHSKLATFPYRPTAVGLALGMLVALSNTYFGLQTGHSDSMGVPSAVLGYFAFCVFDSKLQTHLGPPESVYIQGVAGAVGTMPMAAGLISTAAGLENMLLESEGGELNFSGPILIIWSLGLCFFGAIFAMFMRRRILD